MKTQNNNQETSKSQVSKSTSGASAILFGAVLISLSVNAQDLWKEFSNSASYGKMALIMDGQLNETENADAAFEAINAEVAKQLYYANEMFITEAEAEETMEVENWMTVETNFTSTIDFNAVETEESMKIESWMTEDEIFNSTEVSESAEPALEVEPWMTEESLFMDAEQYTANTADDEIAKYAERILNAVEAEETMEVESWMTEDRFFAEAEQYTANTAEAEIAKYAERIVNAEETEEALSIESWMTTEEYFNSTEVLANEESLEVESWMLEAENFTPQYPQLQYATK